MTTPNDNTHIPEGAVALLPCPFCGDGDVRLTTNADAGMSWVACPACGLEAPSETGVSADGAVTYWNRRAFPSPSEEARPVAVKGLEYSAEQKEAIGFLGHHVLANRGEFTSDHARTILGVMAELERRAATPPAAPMPAGAVTECQAAYALLWRMRTTDKAIHEARRSLLSAIGKEAQREGLDWALRTFGPRSEPTLEELP